MRGLTTNARLPGDVHERVLPRLAVVRGRREVELDTRLVKRERERHVVLPADEPSDSAHTRLDGPQPGAVLDPHEPLVVGGDELPVLEDKRAVLVVDEQRVVERSVSLRVGLGHAGRDEDAVLTGDLTDPLLGRTGNGDGFAGEHRERRLRLRIHPAGERLGPGRRGIGRQVRLWEDHQRGAVARRLGGEPASFSIEASRSSTTGSAWTQATVSGPFIVNEDVPPNALKNFIRSSMNSNL